MYSGSFAQEWGDESLASMHRVGVPVPEWLPGDLQGTATGSGRRAQRPDRQLDQSQRLGRAAGAGNIRGPRHHQYKAVSYRKGDRKNRDEYAFTVSRHGSRWYLSAELPEKYGSHFVIAGFELTESHELVVYTLDIDRIKQLIDQKTLTGQTLETEKGEGVLVSSPLDQVFAWLDDPANSDVFLEMARYQRLPK